MLKFGHLVTKYPTVHPNFERFKIGRSSFGCYDLGGHKSARKLWSDYLTRIDGVIFVIDTADNDRLEEARAELTTILSDPSIANTPICVLGNKIDVSCMDSTTLAGMLGISHLLTGTNCFNVPPNERPMEIFMCSIKNKTGYGEGFRWMSNFVK